MPNITVITKDALDSAVAGKIRVELKTVDAASGNIYTASVIETATSGTLVLSVPINIMADYWFVSNTKDIAWFIGSLSAAADGNLGTLLRTAAGQPTGAQTRRAASGNFLGALIPAQSNIEINTVNSVIAKNGDIIVFAPAGIILDSQNGFYSITLPQTDELFSSTGESTLLRLSHNGLKLGINDFSVPAQDNLSFIVQNESIVVVAI